MASHNSNIVRVRNVRFWSIVRNVVCMNYRGARVENREKLLLKNFLKG